MNSPSPAIVEQAAVRRLPRPALLLLCLAYLLAGFVGRSPWKSEDIASFGTMVALARGTTDWLAPTLLGMPSQPASLLPYWLGAWAMQALPWLDPTLASRLPFMALLALCLLATWWAVYYLARSPQAQPVAFAFGGEADPMDYARAMGDAGLLALIACLGLAQLSHEATGALVQLCGLSLTLYACAAAPYRSRGPLIAWAVGLLMLTLGGAALMAMVLGAGCALLGWNLARIRPDADAARFQRIAIVALAITLACGVLGALLAQWQWRHLLSDNWLQWRGLARLLIWFTWPAWPLALWTLWRWRRQLWGSQLALHVALPCWLAFVALAHAVTSHNPDRALLAGLPALAALAAFGLPTLKRSFTSLIDWFTLIFFTGCALVVWVVWIAMQTGFPAQPAANVAKLAPGFEPSFSWFAFLVAIASSAAWLWLVHWRAGRHRAALWKSMVLPASGAALTWMLLTTLWLPLLDYARSYAPMVQRVTAIVKAQACLQSMGLTRSQTAALLYHGNLRLVTGQESNSCAWMLVDPSQVSTYPINFKRWQLVTSVRHPADRKEDLLLFRRIGSP